MQIDDDVRAFLDAAHPAVIATLNPDGSPQLSIIWYERRADEVVINTTDSRRKARNLERDPRVSLVVGDADRYVRLEGDARVIATGADAVRDIRQLAVRYSGEEAAERQTRDVWSAQQRVTYTIAIRSAYRYGFD